MAKVSSLIKFQGTIDGLTIDRNGVARKAQGSRDVNAARTKENNTEFGTAAQQGKVIRDALRSLGGDKYLTSRMLATVRRGVALDPSNDRGKRILSNNEAKQVLPGFELNGNTNLLTIVPLSTQIENGKLILEKIGGGNLTATDIYTPDGTTDIQLIALVTKINIDPTVLQVDSTIVASNELGSNDLTLPEIEVVPDPVLLTIVAVAIKFYQKVNNSFYPLQNGGYDAGKIIAVL